MLSKYLRSIKGLNIAITGNCWTSRENLIRMIKVKGGCVSSRGNVHNYTDVLIRGISGNWKYRKYGKKEELVANLIKKGKKIIVVHDLEFKKLLKSGTPAKELTIVAGQPLEWLQQTVTKNTYFKLCKTKGSLDWDFTTKGRIEQSFLRKILFGGKDEEKCSICGKMLPVQVMIAGHIKPRSECLLKEKKDFYNIVFPVCLLGCDILYERGFISINDNGIINATKSLHHNKSLNKVLLNLKGKSCPFWNDNNRKYFQWHFERRFIM